MEPASSDVRVEAAPTPTPPGISQSVDPSPQQPSHQQSCSNPNPNPNPNPNFPQTTNKVQFNRQPAWVGSQQPASQLSLLPPQLHSPAGFAIGVPANSSQPAPIPRNLDSSPLSVRPSMSSSMGVIGSHLRPGGVPQHRSVSPAIRPPYSTSSPLPTLSQNFQGHGILNSPPVAIPSSSTPSTSQSQQSSHQPWLSTQHGRPPMPSVRPPMTFQTLQPKTHISQQSLQPMPATSQPQQMLSFPQQQQHFPSAIHSQDNNGQQLPSSRNPQPLINQPQFSRVQSSGNQRPSSPASIIHSGATDQIGSAETLDSCTRIVSKRNIQELVNQVDPLEKLDPEVEDVLVDIADDFIDSVTTFGCSLAKHRKSNTLEAKDILLHLERTWNMTLPGFSGDEIKTYKKPVGNDIHKERLAVIKKSLTGPEVNKSSAGQAVSIKKGI